MIAPQAPQAALHGGHQRPGRSGIVGRRRPSIIGTVLGLDDHVVMPAQRLPKRLLAGTILIVGSGIHKVDTGSDGALHGRDELLPVLHRAAGRAVAEFRHPQVGAPQPPVEHVRQLAAHRGGRCFRISPHSLGFHSIIMIQVSRHVNFAVRPVGRRR